MHLGFEVHVLEWLLLALILLQSDDTMDFGCLGGVTVRALGLAIKLSCFQFPGRAAIKLPRSTQPSIPPG